MIKPAAIITFMLVAIISHGSDNDSTASFTKLEILDNSSASILSLDKKKERDKKHKNRRAGRPIGINIYGFGPTGIVGGSLDAFLTPKLAIEGGAGVENEQGDLNYFVGARYHLLGGTRLNLTPYIGAYTSFHATGRGDVQNHAVYFPFGIHRINKKGFNWAVEGAFLRSTRTDKNFYGGFKLGYRF